MVNIEASEMYTTYFLVAYEFGWTIRMKYDDW